MSPCTSGPGASGPTRAPGLAARLCRGGPQAQPAALVAWVLLGVATAAQAGRPLQTEDAEPVALGRCEIDAEAARQRAGGTRTRGEAIDFGCGLVAGTQASLGHARVRAPEGTTHTLRLGFKTVVWRAEGDAGPALSVVGALAAARAPEGAWARDTSTLKAALTVPALGALWHLNLGHLHDPAGRQQGARWGLAWELEAQAVGHMAWAPMAELVGGDPGGLLFNAGLRCTVVAERLWVDLSWQHQRSDPATRGLALGLKLAF